ncbi:MAG TPA: RluA family pseudouridine synthase [Verrucomicrobiae bacterium]|jgi:23S rRNA pseudouridine1911/1915/1917 synthase
MKPPESNERPLLEWLLRLHPDTPRTRAKQWILAGRVSVGGEVRRKPHEALDDPGDSLRLLDRHATTLDCGGAGWQIHPRVGLLYLDSALALLNKGPGLLAVPAVPGELSASSILADFLVGKLKALERGVAGRTLPPAYRKLQPLPVHRLDQYTSGVFCVALNPKARGHLIEQLKAHTMRREYVAFAEGRASAPKGTWRHWLALTEDELRQQIVPANSPNAQEAVTHYEVIAEYPSPAGVITKLRLRLETGRKHQIRAQAAHSGLPLVGDRAYNKKNSTSIEFPRQALHAELLTLEHPQKPGQRMTWRADFPKDLRQLESSLRKTA